MGKYFSLNTQKEPFSEVETVFHLFLNPICSVHESFQGLSSAFKDRLKSTGTRWPTHKTLPQDLETPALRTPEHRQELVRLKKVIER